MLPNLHQPRAFTLPPPTVMTRRLSRIRLGSHAGAPLPAAAPVALPAGDHRASSGWVLVVFGVLALGFIALTAANYRRVATAADALEQAYRRSPQNVVGRGACEPLARTQPPTMFDPDSHVWINLTQRQVHDGTVRPHDFPYDNAPVGRERHWSSSFSWWLLALAAPAHWLGGLPWDAALAQPAAWANPVLFALFLGGLALRMRRRFDPGSTGVFLVTLAASWGVEWDFSYGRPDHHGLHLMAFLGLVLGVLMGGLGWTRVGPALSVEPDTFLVRLGMWRQARRWFTLSAVCGGVGLWIGSTQQVVCIAVLGVGATLGTLIFGGPKGRVEGVRFAPELWLHWSRVGALTSLVFYVVEYFPAHMEMRLEVNHPLLALGWLGAGELMTILILARTDWPNVQRRGREIALRGLMGVLAASLFPLAVLCGPKSWFTLGDPVLIRSTKVISEGRPWIDPPGLGRALHEFWSYTGVLTLALPLAVAVLVWRRRRLPAWRQAGLVVGLTLGTVFLGWTLLQNRWMGFMETSLAVLALLVAPCVPLPATDGWRKAAGLPLVLLALTVPGWAGYGLLQTRTYAEEPVVHARAVLGDMMVAKEVAWNLKLYADARPDKTHAARVMAAPGPSPALHYYGGIDTVASYYWENLDGCHVGIDFYNDEGDATARRIARERDLDFVVATAAPSFVLELQWLRLGRTDVAAARRTLAFRLASPQGVGGGALPDWLEALPLQDAPMARAEGARIYRVVKARL